MKDKKFSFRRCLWVPLSALGAVGVQAPTSSFANRAKLRSASFQASPYSPPLCLWGLEKTSKAAAALGNSSQGPVWSEVTFAATRALATCAGPGGFRAPAPEPAPAHIGVAGQAGGTLDPSSAAVHQQHVTHHRRDGI